jgi:hypothetical protein
VGKGALAPCPPVFSFAKLVGTLRFAHPNLRNFTKNRHTPRMRGIQYAAASRFYYRRLWILGHPPSRVTTAGSGTDSIIKQRNSIPETSSPPRREAPEVCFEHSALFNQRAQGMPGADAPAAARVVVE